MKKDDDFRRPASASAAWRGSCRPLAAALLCCSVTLLALQLARGGGGGGGGAGEPAAPLQAARGSAGRARVAAGGNDSASAVSAAAAQRAAAAPKRVWVTEELAEYASLVQEGINEGWARMDAELHGPGGGGGGGLRRAAPFGRAESEFFAALTQLSLNVSTVCELGMGGDGRSAVTWLEALPWTTVYTLGRPPPEESDDSGGDGSFGPPEPVLATELTAADLAAEAAQARARAYLGRAYGSRYRYLPLERVTAKEIRRVAAENSISKCDVVVIYATSWAEGMAPVEDAARINTPLSRLGTELMSMQAVTKGWHFVLMDGMGCSDQVAASMGELGKAQLAPGATGDCPPLPGSEPLRRQILPPQRVQATWAAAAEAHGLIPYECKIGAANAPGWCLGTFRAPVGNHGMGAVPPWDPNGAGEGPRVLNWLSSDGMYLNVGDRLQSKEENYHLSMQEDGNLVIYKNEDGGAVAKAVWSSRTSGDVGAYFLSLQVREPTRPLTQYRSPGSSRS